MSGTTRPPAILRSQLPSSVCAERGGAALRTGAGWARSGRAEGTAGGSPCGGGPVRLRSSGLIVEVTRAQSAASSRSEEHTSELQSTMRISSAVFCLKKNNTKHHQQYKTTSLAYNEYIHLS